MSGAQWTIMGFLVNRAISLVSMLFIARILMPAEFGIVALATTIYTGILIFRDLGLGATLITDAGLGPEGRSAIFTLYLILSPSLAVVLVAVAIACSVLGYTPLAACLLVLAVQALLSAPSWYLWPAIQQAQLFRVQFFTQAIQSSISAIASIGFALAGYGPAGVMFGQLLGVAVSSAYQWIRTRLLPRPVWSPNRMRDALVSGRGFFAQGGIAYVSQSAGNYVSAILLGPAAVGTYNAAYRIAELPYSAIANPIFQVLFVRLSARWNSHGDVSAEFSRSLRVVVFLSLPLSIVFLCAPSSLVEVVLGPNWIEAAPVLGILAVWGVIRTVQSCYGWLLNSVGRAGVMARIAFWTLAIEIPALAVGAIFWGASGVALGMTLDMAVSLVMLLLVTARSVGSHLAAFHRILWRQFAIAIVTTGATFAAARLTNGIGAFPSLACCAAVCVILYTLLALALERETVSYLWAALMDMTFRRGKAA